MAKNYNIVSATFDGQTMLEPQNYRARLEGRSDPNSAGVDAYISSLKLSNRRCVIQVAFNDQGSVQSMATKFGGVGTLTIVTKLLDGTNKTATITNCTCTAVVAEAQHADYGQHVCEFEGVTTDGATIPLSWA